MLKNDVELRNLFLLSEIISTKSDIKSIKEKIISEQTDWIKIVEIANSNYLTAALYFSLLEKNLLQFINDTKLLSYLEYIYSVNLDRNLEAISQAKEIVQILAKKSIKAIFLKGVAILLREDYNGLGIRYISDIDFCIFEDDIEEGNELLLSSGYAAKDYSTIDFTRHHHLAPLEHSRWNLIIEPHKKILAHPYSEFIKCNDKNSELISNETNLYTLNATFRLIHVYMHSDYSNHNYILKNIDLKQLYEMSILIDIYEDKLDWDYIESFFCSHRLEKQFNDKLCLIGELFKVYAPIIKRDNEVNFHLKVLYYHFKYKNYFFHKLFFYFRILFNEFSYRNISRIYAVRTKRKFVLFFLKYLIVKSKKLFNKIIRHKS